MSEPRLPCHRVCIVLLMRIGDVVWGLPIANALKRQDPSREITWVVESGPAPLLDPHPSVDRVIAFDRKKGLKELVALWRRLRPLQFEVVLCVSHYFKSAIPAVMARAPHKISFGPDRASDLQWIFSNHNLPPSRSYHMQRRYLEFLDFLGIEYDEDAIEWRIRITDAEREAQSRFFEQFGTRDVVGIVTASYGLRNSWPADRFGRLAAVLAREHDLGVILLGGPDPGEQALAREIQRAAGDDRVVWGLGPDLRRLVYLIDGCSLVVSVDTGPLHIARALQRPVIGLYGTTDPWRTGPYRAYQDLWVDRYNFDSSENPVDPPRADERDNRMRQITVEDVLARVEIAKSRYLARKEVRES